MFHRQGNNEHGGGGDQQCRRPPFHSIERVLLLRVFADVGRCINHVPTIAVLVAYFRSVSLPGSGKTSAAQSARFQPGTGVAQVGRGT